MNTLRCKLKTSKTRTQISFNGFYYMKLFLHKYWFSFIFLLFCNYSIWFTILNIQSREPISKTIFYTSLIMTVFGRETTRATKHYIPQETDITFLSNLRKWLGDRASKLITKISTYTSYSDIWQIFRNC